MAAYRFDKEFKWNTVRLGWFFFEVEGINVSIVFVRAQFLVRYRLSKQGDKVRNIDDRIFFAELFVDFMVVGFVEPYILNDVITQIGFFL